MSSTRCAEEQRPISWPPALGGAGDMSAHTSTSPIQVLGLQMEDFRRLEKPWAQDRFVSVLPRGGLGMQRLIIRAGTNETDWSLPVELSCKVLVGVVPLQRVPRLSAEPLLQLFRHLECRRVWGHIVQFRYNLKTGSCQSSVPVLHNVVKQHLSWKYSRAAPISPPHSLKRVWGGDTNRIGASLNFEI
jgi:hypothetical protein